jgi:surface antigen
LLDQEDKKKMKEASLKALSTGKKQSWSSPKKGTSGDVSVKNSKSEGGNVCKMLLQTTTLPSGEIVNREKKVCRDKEGWQVAS